MITLGKAIFTLLFSKHILNWTLWKNSTNHEKRPKYTGDHVYFIWEAYARFWIYNTVWFGWGKTDKNRKRSKLRAKISQWILGYRRLVILAVSWIGELTLTWLETTDKKLALDLLVHVHKNTKWAQSTISFRNSLNQTLCIVHVHGNINLYILYQH